MLVPAVAARAEKIGDIDVLVQPLPNTDVRSGREDGVSHGYVEYRVQLKNSSAKDCKVELVYPASRDYSRSGVVASRTVQVLAGQEASVSLFQPPSSDAWGSMSVRVEGVKEARQISVGSLRRESGGYGYDYGPGPRSAVLLSRGVPQDFRDRAGRPGEKPAPEAPGPPGYGPSGYGPEEYGPRGPALLRSEVPVSQWSPNWLGYSCYDAILLTQREAEEMPAPAQAAVRRYLECGGELLVHGRKVPDVFSRGGLADGQGGYHVGLGRAAATSDEGEPGWDRAYRRLTAASPETYRPREKPNDQHGLLVGEAKVPVRGLFFLVLLFAVAIGPVNVWLLSKHRKRIWLWWNVPAISLLTCLAVFLYAMFSEGWTSRGRIASLTLLDERCHRATTIGYVSLYCPLTPGGVHFGADSDVALLSHERPYSGYSSPYSRYREPEGGPRQVDWTSDQHLVSGWVTARVPAYFQVRKNEDRRERLSVGKKADGSVTVVNALGADVRRLYVADGSGRVFEGRDIPAGAERTLSAATGGWKLSAGAQAELRQLLTRGEWLSAFRNWNSGTNLGPILSAGGYVAFLDKSPFIESPVAGASCEHTVAIVCGISEGPGDGR